MRFASFGVSLVICAMALGADEPSEQHRLAATLLDAMNMEVQINASFEAAKAAIPAQLKQMEAIMPAAPKGEKHALRAEQTKKMMEEAMAMIAEEMKWERVKADYINLYAETFSANELNELIAFYRSPAGQSLVAKQPELNRRATEMAQKSIVRLMSRIVAMPDLSKPPELFAPEAD